MSGSISQGVGFARVLLWPAWVIGTLFGTACLCIGDLGEARAQEEEFWTLAPGESPPMEFVGAWCIFRATCPRVFLWDSNGDLLGCEKVLNENQCTGNCNACSGSGNPGSFCLKKAGYTCVVLGTGMVDCGVVEFYPCYWVGMGAGGDSRGCGCKKNAEPYRTESPCEAAECLE